MSKILFTVVTILLITISCNTTKKTTTIEESQNALAVQTEQPAQSQNQQSGPGQGGRGGNFENSEAMLAMVESLMLNDEQKVQFEAINRVFSEKMQKKREEARASGGFEGMREEMQKLRADQNGALKNLLTDEQFAIYDGFVKKQQAERDARRGNRG